MHSGRAIPRSIMKPACAVVAPPPVGGRPDLAEGPEHVQAQAFVAIRSIEPFAVGVLLRLSGLDVMYSHPD